MEWGRWTSPDVFTWSIRGGRRAARSARSLSGTWRSTSSPDPAGKSFAWRSCMAEFGGRAARGFAGRFQETGQEGVPRARRGQAATGSPLVASDVCDGAGQGRAAVGRAGDPGARAAGGDGPVRLGDVGGRARGAQPRGAPDRRRAERKRGASGAFRSENGGTNGRRLGCVEEEFYKLLILLVGPGGLEPPT